LSNPAPDKARFIVDMLVGSPTDTKLNRVIAEAGRYIKSCQQDNGAILWFEGDKLDPWDHTEAIMGLCIVGEFDRAKRALQWLANHQRADGSWCAKYYGDVQDGDLDRVKIDSNFVAYPACGLWHYFLITGDRCGMEALFPCIDKAIDYVVAQQHPEGDIQWAKSEQETLPDDALVTACSSIIRSLESAILLAAELRLDRPRWRQAYIRACHALLNKPWRFDRTWESKQRFSMDWFYPILAGIYTQHAARNRLTERWHEFVESGVGCRCVSDEPWMTVAESCELTLALVASGQRQKARELFTSLLNWQDEDGGFWTGYSFRDKAIWPLEKTSWTAAAILLATDALENLTPAAQMFTRPSHLLFA